MAISFEISQTINCPITKTFSFLSDPRNLTLWNYYIQSITLIPDEHIAAGTKFEQRRPHDLQTYKISEYVLNDRLSVELQPPGPQQQFSIIFSEEGDETHVVYKWKVELENYKLLKYIPSGKFKQWLLSFAERHVQKIIRPATTQNFLKLKTLLETGEVILQDGRKSVLH